MQLFRLTREIENGARCCYQTEYQARIIKIAKSEFYNDRFIFVLFLGNVINFPAESVSSTFVVYSESLLWLLPSQ